MFFMYLLNPGNKSCFPNNETLHLRVNLALKEIYVTIDHVYCNQSQNMGLGSFVFASTQKGKDQFYC